MSVDTREDELAAADKWLAAELNRIWLLSERALRAFQKASFTPVCDVIHAKMATVDRVVCRPPDPEALELLGQTD